METPQPIPPVLIKNNIYALLSPIGGGAAFLGNCITLVSIVVPGLPFLCATFSGLFSLSALVTGIVGLVQVKKTGQKGRGLAITGVALGVLGIITACLLPFIGTVIWTALGWQAGDALLVPTG